MQLWRLHNRELRIDIREGCMESWQSDDWEPRIEAGAQVEELHRA